MNNLFSLKLWFNTRPGSITPGNIQILLIFIVILAVLTVIIGIVKSRNKQGLYSRFWKSLSSFCLTNLIVGVIILFFMYESLPLLSARFWFIVWLAEMVTWLAFIAKHLKTIPQRREELEREREFKKYIP